jgi:hypothetical protein
MRVDQNLRLQSFYALCTDGWKRKFCAGATPLINVCALLPDGGTHFLKIVTAGGVIKDGTWVYQMHKDLIMELEPENPRRILGLVLDGAPANVCGMKQLEEEFPFLILFCCQAHALHLFIKDLIGSDKKNGGRIERCPWAAKVGDATDARAHPTCTFSRARTPHARAHPACARAPRMRARTPHARGHPACARAPRMRVFSYYPRPPLSTTTGVQGRATAVQHVR